MTLVLDKSPLKKILIFAAFIALACFLFSQIVFWMPRWLIVNDSPQKSEVIVILNGLHIKERIDHGVSLYKKGYAPRILLSGTFELEHETGINTRKIYTMSLGVPESAIDVENNSLSTYEDARGVEKYLSKHQYKSFILVTSPQHTRRSSLFFKAVIPSDIRWAVSCNPAQLNLRKWWNNVSLSREIFYEYLALPYCFFRRQ